MSCSYNHCSGGCPGCNNAYARVNYHSCNSYRNDCSRNHCGSHGCGCSSCSSCNGCDHCTCSHSCSSGNCHHCNSCGSGCSACCNSWNNGRSGRGCSSGHGLGVLRSVCKPFSNCSNWWTNNPDFPFYTGPCGPCACACDCCNGCHEECCDPCCNDCCDPCGDCCETLALSGDCCHTTATFYASTPVELAAGDCVALGCSSDLNDEFSVTPEGIRIHRCGTYMVLYTVHVPAGEAVSSRFSLALNGDRVAASALDVATSPDCSTNGYTMHAMVHAGAGDLLKLVSNSNVSIGTSSASNVFTLTLTRIP